MHGRARDVFAFEGRAGEELVFEVTSERLGAALDSLLTLYDGEGHQQASQDDAKGTRDSRLEVKLARNGRFYLVLMDAQDQGGPAHLYRLRISGTAGRRPERLWVKPAAAPGAPSRSEDF